jgi:hypothetical protein
MKIQKFVKDTQAAAIVSLSIQELLQLVNTRQLKDEVACIQLSFDYEWELVQTMPEVASANGNGAYTPIIHTAIAAIRLDDEDTNAQRSPS